MKIFFPIFVVIIFVVNVFFLHRELDVHCPTDNSIRPPRENLLAVVINGGRRTNDISNLLSDLTNLSIPWIVYSDEHNVDMKRGDVRQPSYPFSIWKGKEGLKTKTWRINLLWYDLVPRLLDERSHEMFLILENDVVICNQTMLMEALRYFEDHKNHSLSLWQFRSCTSGDPIIFENYTNLEVFPRRPCGMQATLLDRQGLRKLRHALSHVMERKSIEFALKRSKRYKYSVRNGVVVHTGTRSTDGRKKTEYTCESTKWESWK